MTGFGSANSDMDLCLMIGNQEVTTLLVILI
jgi:hypothetical protein